MTRARRTKLEMHAFKETIFNIVEANKPCSVRQVYYIGIGRLWDKDQGGKRKAYNTLDRVLGDMRESGELPWGWLADSTRYVRIATMYDSVDDALARTAEFYRRNLWADQSRRVEVWAESDSTASLVDPVTRKLGVGLYSCRGQAGKEFAHSAAMAYTAADKPVVILYVGDWDPSGLGIPRSLLERLERYTAGQVAIDLRRLAVTDLDVALGDFTTHEVNASDGNYSRFAAECRHMGLAPQTAVEVEAIPPPELRGRVETALYDLIDDADAWNLVIDAEESEREILGRIATSIGGER